MLRLNSFCLLAMVLMMALMSCTLRETQLGDELEQKGDFDGAVAAYREAVRIDPFNTELNEKLKRVKLRAAEQHFSRGKQMLKEQKVGEALQEFQIAVGLDPEKNEYHTALNDVWRSKTAQQILLDAKSMESLGRYDESLQLYESAVELDHGLVEAVEGITRVVQLQKATQAIGGSAEPVTLRFQNTRLKQVFEILARTANIDILFDKDVRDDLVTIFTKDTPFDEALNLILTTNQLFAKRVGPDRLLVIPDTKQKREQYDDLQIRTFYLSNAKAKDMANLLRTILETKRVYVNEPLNTVVIRDEPDKVGLAEQIILANDRNDSEVLFEVEVLEVNRTNTQNLGLQFAKEAGFGIFPPGTESPNSAAFSLPSTFSFKQLTDIGQESFLFRFPSSVLLNFFKQESQAKTLASPKLRVLNNEKASINVGDKQPILLSTTNVLPGQASTGAVPTTSTVTSIEFKDTGIKLTVEPTVHLNRTISLRLQIEVTRLGERVILQASPLITQFKFGTRTADTALNMRDGETVVLGGLLSEDNTKTRDSVPGVDDIPVLGELFSNTNTNKVVTEVILVITPHIVRSVTPPQLAKHTMWSGTSNQYSTKPMFSQPNPAVSLLNTQDLLPDTTDSSESTAFPKDSSLTEGKTPLSTSVEPGSVDASPSMTDRPRLQVLPTATSVKVGDQISITIQGENLSSVGKTSLTLTYDPAVLSFAQANEGTVWTSQQMVPSMTVSAVPHLGQLVLQMGQEETAVQGSGSLATVTFEATGTGNSNIHIQQSTFLGANGQSIPVMVEHGRVLVE
ncbi:cohesin domain-containing protein [Candidatus Nitrospira neomarina]|uniref:Cohesin domain-containing protein n=1 Tax=Candidatus Nitrospira neomarina TaxID=3020899 RepID=A0AA96JWS2_9BACT|nr:cohesin domain-containing protein [Candidatus Nitrospira neomarina]WNM63102.1 cohesin domain-containing protein [Candidatus Nitrospira neomarina]